MSNGPPTRNAPPMEPQEARRAETTLSRESSFPIAAQLGIIAGIIALLLLAHIFNVEQADPVKSEPTPQPVNATTATPVIKKPDTGAPTQGFDTLNLQAAAAIVYDVKHDEILYAKDQHTPYPIASITKLMTALLAHEILDPNTSLQITAESVRQIGDSGLRREEVFQLNPLIELTLVKSLNDGAYALAAAAGRALTDDDTQMNDHARAFVKAMNVRANELGLTDTYFRNPTGLDVSADEPGATASAHDVAKLTSYLLRHHPSLLESTAVAADRVYNATGEHHLAENTNRIVEEIPGVIASKTGYTDLAGGTLVVAFRHAPGHPIVVAVLGSTFSGRFSDVLQLVEATNHTLLQP